MGVEPATAATGTTGAYARIRGLIADGRCVVLDGGTATELPGLSDTISEHDERLWGTSALIQRPDEVLAVHRSYAELGCDLISTNTWGLPTALRHDGPQVWASAQPVHWMDVARRGLDLAREAVDRAGRRSDCAVAFSLNGDVDGPEGAETIHLLARLFEEEQPDLILLETLALVRDSTYDTVTSLLETGLPVWLSFRRCRHGVCGVFGQHWGGPEGDAFGRAARRFEDLGAGALLINCLPPDHVTGMLPWLRDFTDLPLGVYPNLGYYSDAGWRYEEEIAGEEFAELALAWRGEGAQIVGGCCGVGPDHIARVRDALAGTAAGAGRRADGELEPSPNTAPEPGPAAPRWTDERGRDLFPLPFPDLACEPGVFVPTQGSFLLWKHLFQHGVGRDLRCLDVGCGTGLLSVQLALNGATHVHAIDLDRRAVDNTLGNAFRHGVAERVSADTVDLFPWVPEERYELIVASLYQMPVDPFEQVTTHRPLDYWGRNLIDHLITKLPAALAPGGVAYLMQLSVIGQERTAARLAEHGLEARVVDFSFFEFHELFLEKREQIARVEELSDAYHLKLDDSDVMVAYLLEVRSESLRSVSRR